MLSVALAWRAGWLDLPPLVAGAAAISDRDVLAIGLMAQLFDAELVAVEDGSLATSLQRTLPPELALRIVVEAFAAVPAGVRTVMLCPVDALNETGVRERSSATETCILLYGLGGAIPLYRGSAQNGVALLHLHPLSSVSPCLWNSGLGVALLTDGSAEPRKMLGELAVVLGDQSLDPLPLYEELCRLRQRHNAGTAPEGTARARATTVERDLAELRRFVQGQIEKATLAVLRTRASLSPETPIDWSMAFAPSSDSVAPVGSALTGPSETEMRARRARIEAEFLRGQLRAYALPRKVDHHQLIALSGFFDIPWYASTYDVAPGAAIDHYLSSGASAGNDPSPIFSTRHYLSTYADVGTLHLNPLLHYLMDGIYEGRSIDPPIAILEETWRTGFTGVS